MKNNNFPIDRFEAFLARSFTVLFERKSQACCPVGMWLRDRDPVFASMVKVNLATAIVAGKRRRLPAILEDFIADVDDREGKISGCEALRILHKNMGKTAHEIPTPNSLQVPPPPVCGSEPESEKNSSEH